MPDIGRALSRAIVAAAARDGVRLDVRTADWTRWSSATFVGARHALRVEMQDDTAAQRWLKALPEIELTVSGHIVADVVVAALQRRDGIASAAIEALTVEA